MSPHWRRRMAWVLLVASLVGWPLSMVWFARDEPPFVLSLSWLALTLTALDLLATTDARVKVGDDDERDSDAHPSEAAGDSVA